MVPEGAASRMRIQGPPAIKLINQTAKLILKTSFQAWEQRNEETQTWLDSNPELKDRKKHADMTGWKSVSNKRIAPIKQKIDKDEHLGERYKRIKTQAEAEAQNRIKLKEIEAEAKIHKYMADCLDNGALAAHPACRFASA